MFFKCKRKGVFLSRECITRRRFLTFFGAVHQFSAILFITGYIWTKICKEDSTFFIKKIARERVYFSKILQAKGYGFRDRVGTPAYKN